MDYIRLGALPIQHQRSQGAAGGAERWGWGVAASTIAPMSKVCGLATAKVPSGAKFEATDRVSIKYVDLAGRARVCGGPELKGTQAYPDAFGARLAELFYQHLESTRDVDVSSEDSDLDGDTISRFLGAAGEDEDMWEDAKMGEVVAWLAAQ